VGYVLEFLVLRVLARLWPARYRVIPRRDGSGPLLRQFKIWGMRDGVVGGSSIYLQSFAQAEEESLFHVHRWKRMLSLVLSGSFIEERFPGVGPHPRRFFKTHKAPSVYGMDLTTIHRLHAVAPRSWTLFLQVGNTREWGYFARPLIEYTPWDQAIPDERKVKAL
jgi:hypothetical protein